MNDFLKVFILLLLLLFALTACSSPDEPYFQTDIPLTSSLSEPIVVDSLEDSETHKTETSDSLESKVFPDVYGKWYLSEWARYPSTPPIEQEEDKKGIKIKVPLVHESTSNGLTIKVEFFNDTYLMYSFIQTRITYTNVSEETIKFTANSTLTTGIFRNENGRPFYPIASKNIESLLTCDDSSVILNQGESYTDEIVFFMNTFFEVGSAYTYSVTVKIYPFPPGNTTEEPKKSVLSIPIEVISTTQETTN